MEAVDEGVAQDRAVDESHTITTETKAAVTTMCRYLLGLSPSRLAFSSPFFFSLLLSLSTARGVEECHLHSGGVSDSCTINSYPSIILCSLLTLLGLIEHQVNMKPSIIQIKRSSNQAIKQSINQSTINSYPSVIHSLLADHAVRLLRIIEELNSYIIIHASRKTSLKSTGQAINQSIKHTPASSIHIHQSFFALTRH